MINPAHPRKMAFAEWAEAELATPDLVRRDAACEFWAPGWDRLVARGIPGVMVDPAWGGAGLDVGTALLTFEGLGYGCRDAGLLFAMATQVWTTQPIIERFGTDDQRERWLRPLCSTDPDAAKRGAFCISEPKSGSDTFAMQTTWRHDDAGNYVLNGTKAWVTLGPVADVFVVFATANPELGRWGISAFIVDAQNPGVQVGENQPKLGLRTTPFANVDFVDCVVGPENLLGREGAGAAIFSHAMEAERAFLLVSQLGMMERQLDESVAYARERKQFGQPIADFQAVGHRLANMKLRHEVTRLLLYKAAALVAAGESTMMAASLAKIQTSEASVASSLDALLTFGARGVVSEYGIEQDLRNVAGGIVYGGTSDIQRNIVAELLKGNQ